MLQHSATNDIVDINNTVELNRMMPPNLLPLYHPDNEHGPALTIWSVLTTLLEVVLTGLTSLWHVICQLVSWLKVSLTTTLTPILTTLRSTAEYFGTCFCESPASFGRQGFAMCAGLALTNCFRNWTAECLPIVYTCVSLIFVFISTASTVMTARDHRHEIVKGDVNDLLNGLKVWKQNNPSQSQTAQQQIETLIGHWTNWKQSRFKDASIKDNLIKATRDARTLIEESQGPDRFELVE